MSMNATIRHRLEEQGFCGLDDATLAEGGPWLRWSPVLCTFFMILGVAMQSPVVLWLLAATAFFGPFLAFHPSFTTSCSVSRGLAVCSHTPNHSLKADVPDGPRP